MCGACTALHLSWLKHVRVASRLIPHYIVLCDEHVTAVVADVPCVAASDKYHL